MRVYMDDDERAILAARLGHAPEVSDRSLAASFAAWVDKKPTRRKRTLTARDVEHLAGVIDDRDREAGGYRSDPHWLGVG